MNKQSQDPQPIDQNPAVAQSPSAPLNGLSWQEGLGTLGSEPYVPPKLPYVNQDVSTQYPQAEYVAAPPMDPTVPLPQPAPYDQPQLYQEPATAQWQPQDAAVTQPVDQSDQPQTFAAVPEEYQQPQQSAGRKKIFIIVGAIIALLIVGAILAAILGGKDKIEEAPTPLESASNIPKPNVPAGVTLSSEVANQLVVSWSLNKDTNKYTVEFTKDQNFLLDVQTKDISNATTTTLENLEPGITYYVRIAAKNTAGVSDYSAVQSLIIKQSDAPVAETPNVPVASLSAPGKPSITGTTSSTITTAWSGVAGAQKYRVEFSRTSNFAKMYFEETTATNIRLTGLASSMTYYIRVAAVQNGMTGAWSALSSGTTSAAPSTTPTPTPTPNPTPTPVPGTPTNVVVTLGTVDSAGNTFIKTSWKPTAAATRVEILWTGPALANQPRSPNNFYGVNTDKAQGLRENTRYCFKVREYVGSTAGAWTGEICRTTNKR